MKIAACVKWVPVVARMKFDTETRRLVREGVPSELNGYDVIAVQRAVELKQSTGAEITVYTMGPDNARQGLVRCLAMGADRAFHIADRALAGSDTLATSRALAFALQKESYDLILFGFFSVDAETGQVGPEVAELMGLPQITGASKLEVVGDNTLRAERTLEDGTEVVEVDMPAVVTAAEGIAPEVFPGREETRAAEEREIETLTAKDLNDDLSLFGFDGSPTWVSEIRNVESGREQRLIEDATPADAAAQVVAFLKERGVLDLERRAARSVMAPAPGTVREPTGPEVLVVAELEAGEAVRDVTRELLAAAQPLAEAVGGHVVAVLMGGPDCEAHAEALGRSGADVVAVASDPGLQLYSTDAYSATLTKAIEERKPYAVLLPSTVNGRDLAARVAARLELGLTGDCVGLEVDGEGRLVQLKPAFGGAIEAPIYSKTLPNMATVRPGVFERFEPSASRVPGKITLDPVIPSETRVRHVELWPIDARDTTGLETAWSVICVGKGVGGADRIAELDPLRDMLEARYVCTRDVADAGWMPKQLQVGLTGKTIGPELYVGVGVRGDFNHTVGIRRAGTIVGVNNNKRAAIFRQSDIGVLADWEAFVPSLVEALRAEMG